MSSIQVHLSLRRDSFDVQKMSHTGILNLHGYWIFPLLPADRRQGTHQDRDALGVSLGLTHPVGTTIGTPHVVAINPGDRTTRTPPETILAGIVKSNLLCKDRRPTNHPCRQRRRRQDGAISARLRSHASVVRLPRIDRERRSTPYWVGLQTTPAVPSEPHEPCSYFTPLQLPIASPSGERLNPGSRSRNCPTTPTPPHQRLSPRPSASHRSIRTSVGTLSRGYPARATARCRRLPWWT